MVSTASTNALPMNCPWRNKLSPSPRPRRGVHIVKVCPVDNIYLLCYTATCLSSIAGAGYSSPFPSHQGVHTRWFGRAENACPFPQGRQNWPGHKAQGYKKAPASKRHGSARKQGLKKAAFARLRRQSALTTTKVPAALFLALPSKSPVF